ncbi:MAG: hypothetical protein PHR81_04935 [Bacteroidales bacterium]|nr:hypothetical protein [Bacteroidales bacterium]
MKKIFYAIFSVIIFGAIAQAKTVSYTLSEAIQKKLVKAVFKGRGFTSNAGSSHYGKCISLSLKNLTSQRLEINLETGRELRSFNDSVQDMIISQSEVFALGPNGSSDYTINAFCTEKHETSPKESSIYQMGRMTSGYLYELVLLIETLGCQDNMGQKAVWVLTDSISSDEISGGDVAKAKKLKDFVDFALKKIKGGKMDGYIYDYPFPEKTAEGFKVSGEINWTMPYNANVSLAIYDNKGKKVADIFTNILYKSGFQSYEYEIANTFFREGELYWLRVEGCGQRLKELAVKME